MGTEWRACGWMDSDSHTTTEMGEGTCVLAKGGCVWMLSCVTQSQSAPEPHTRLGGIGCISLDHHHTHTSSPQRTIPLLWSIRSIDRSIQRLLLSLNSSSSSLNSHVPLDLSWMTHREPRPRKAEQQEQERPHDDATTPPCRSSEHSRNASTTLVRLRLRLHVCFGGGGWIGCDCATEG